MYLTIMMPCLNESLTVGKCVDAAFTFIQRNKLDAEVLVIDNGSTDNSATIASKHGATVIFEPKQGYGNAIKSGILAAKGDYVIIGDADYSYDFSNLEGFIQLFESEYELVIGNRMLGKIERGAMPVSHKIGAPILSYFAAKKFKISVGDFHCGLRGFKKSLYDNVVFKSTGMEFATEMIVLSSFLTTHITELPVNLYKDGRSGKSHLRTIPDGLRHLSYIISTKPYDVMPEG